MEEAIQVLTTDQRLDRIEKMLLALIRMQGAAPGALNPRARTQEQMQADTDEANKRIRERDARNSALREIQATEGYATDAEVKAELDKPFEENPPFLTEPTEQEVENKENPLDNPKQLL